MWFLGLVTALLTAYYMTRQVIMTFFGSPRWMESDADAEGAEAQADAHAAGHDDHGHHGLTPDHRPVESPWTMTVPLVVLAVAATLGGLLNLPFSGATKRLGNWLEPVIAGGEHELAGGTLVTLAVVAVVCAAIGIAVAIAIYSQHRVDAAKVEPAVLAHGWYYDETVSAFVAGPGRVGFQATADADRVVIDGAVNGIGAGLAKEAEIASRWSSGQIRRYGLVLGAATIAVLAASLIGGWL